MSRAIKMLLEKGWIRRKQYDRALVQSARYGETPGYHLVAAGAIDDEDLVGFFLRHFSLKYWPKYKLKNIPKEAILAITPVLAKNLRILPIRIRAQNLTLGLTDPSLTHVAEEVSFHTKRFVNPVLVTETDMSWALAYYYSITSYSAKKESLISKQPATLERQTLDMVDDPSQYLSMETSAGAHKPSVVQVTDEGWGVEDWEEEPEETSTFPLPLTQLVTKQTGKFRDLPNLKARETLPPPSYKEGAPRDEQYQREKRSSAVATNPAIKASLWDIHTGRRTIETPPEDRERDTMDSMPPFDTITPPEKDTPKQNISELLGAIKRSGSRDAIIDLALEYLLLFARRTAFLVIRRSEIRGFAIKGTGTNQTAIKSYWVPFSSESTFRQIALEGQIHLGPLGRTSSDSIFTAALGGRPRRVLIVPVEIHNRVVGLLYADKLRIEMPPWNLLERLSEVVSANLTRLILSKAKS